VKKSTILYWSTAILGTMLIALVLVGGYLAAADALSILVSFSFWCSGGFLVVGGIVLLKIGIIGVGRQYFKNHRRLFTALSILLVPPLIFGTFIVGYTFAFVNAPMFPLRSEITQVTMVDNSPLVLALCVKAITRRDTRIDSALILDSNDTLVASYWNENIMVQGVSTFQPICVLPAGSEITVTVDFNTTLPSGSYLIRLSSWHDNHGESFFTMP
jgi:hypothetical protein